MLSLQHKEYVKTFIGMMSSLPDQELSEFFRVLELKSYAANSYFTQVGDTHDRVGLVVQGVFRVYYPSADGKIHIRNFCREGMLLGSYATILTGQPAHVSIQSLEESTVLQFSYGFITERCERHWGWERLARRVAEGHYISREQREYQFLSLDAAGRLEQFRKDFPGLEERIAKAHIASYIGVQPETLSRLSAGRDIS
ncbi:MAG: Crp/Fnr family transcriptional regulator [Bdellovibrionales bacterium]